MTHNNVDKSTIDHFSQQASCWWDPDGPMKTLHQINPLRIDFITEHADLDNKHALDIGCGGGLLTESLAQYAKSAHGIDLSEELIEVAKGHGSGYNNLSYAHESLSQHLTSQKCYDIITCMELLEHVPQPQVLLNDCAKILNPGGLLFVSTINRHWKAFVLDILMGEHILKLLPKGTHQYEKFIKPSTLCQWLRKDRLELKSMMGFNYNPMNKSFYLSQSLDTNYMAVFKNTNNN